MKLPVNIFKLVASIALCQSAGIIGSFFTVSSISNWYNLLNQPSFRPPNFLFGPVWITLYTLMGISFYLIWIKLGDKKYSKKAKLIKLSLVIFLIHLFFNATWSIVFFGLHNIFLALINILVIWVFIVILISKFWSLDKRASVLLIPYLAWVSFATILNYSIWILNR
ncbi:tryptophan-rich sensory protein [Candidatus Daviesbacteria bacterium]|nr:tryptophan-rich sensory protein [Candidatus Daviesbacteria bacterium]